MFAQKINKVFEFYMIFAGKVTEFCIIIARKIFFSNLGRRGHVPSLLPLSPTPVVKDQAHGG